MGSEPLATFLRRLRSRVAEETAGGLTDAQLLDRFVRERDEAAFEALFWRHAPTVLGVCRRMLPAADVEDAFQATFLALVRKAGSIRRREAVAAWLHSVACRVALRARTASAARAAAELPPEGPADADREAEAVWRDLRPVLDEEIRGLPEKYRSPVVLCYLQGKTNEEAARQLGCPTGTVAVRLMRARERLRFRLGRRGVTLSGALLGTLLAETARAAPVEAALAASTIKAALLCAAGQPIAAVASSQVAALAEGVLRAMFLTKVKVTAVALLAVGILVTGAGLLGPHFFASAAPAPQAGDPPTGQPRLTADVVSQVSGQVVVVGTEVKPGERVREADLVVVKAGDKEVKYRRLREGDAVEAGQVVALVDDALAREDVAIARAKLEAAEADFQAAEKTREEALQRFETAKKLLAMRAISQEEYRAAQLTNARYAFEGEAKRAGVAVAQAEERRAETLLNRHAVRTRVGGVITRIYRQPGEGVNALEAVIQIRMSEK
jgi:RNA polymerase sigma factor (sigma-70 family)